MFGFIDYRLAKRSLLSALRRGKVDPLEICDAHPELLRAAKNIGRPLEIPCPVCGHDSLKEVKYVFGDELKTNNGRVVYPDDWVDQLSDRYNEFRCYVIEVCTDCSWNHLESCYLLGRRYSGRAPKRKVSKRSFGAE